MKGQQLNVQISALIDKIRNMDDKLYKGQISEAFVLLQRIIDGMEQVMTGYGSLRESAEEILLLNEKLSEINDTIVGKDFVRLADIFEYEVIGILEEIGEEMGNH